MKKYIMGDKKTKLLYFLLVIFIVITVIFAVISKDLKFIVTAVISFLFFGGGLIFILMSKQVYIVVNDERVDLMYGEKISSTIKYSDIDRIVYDDFLGVFSQTYLIPKGKSWVRSFAIQSHAANYKDCLREILSRVPATTWVDPELLKFLNAKPKPVKDQFKRVGYVISVGAAIFILIMIAAVLAMKFNIKLE